MIVNPLIPKMHVKNKKLSPTVDIRYCITLAYTDAVSLMTITSQNDTGHAK